MKAILLEKSGSPEILQVSEIPDPVLGDEEVLVKLKYAGINYAELLSRKGLYQWAPNRPYVLGMEGSGEVVAVGSKVTKWQVGDRVIYVGQKGSYAEYVSQHQDLLLPPPKHFTWKESAAFAATWATAYIGLHEMARVRSGERLLVHAAAGGVGTAAVQLGIAHGMEVYGTASTAEKRARIEELGAVTLEYHDFHDKLYSMGKRPNCVIETIGGDVFKRSYRLLAPMGRIVLIGITGLKFNKYNPLSWYSAWKYLPRTSIAQVTRKSRAFMGLHVGYLFDTPELVLPLWANLIKVVEDNDIHPEIGDNQVFALSDVGKAHQYIHDRKNIGKVLLEINK